MSAYLDKSQGICFDFSEPRELYIKSRNAQLDAPYFAGRVLKAKDIKVEEFKPRELKPAPATRPYPVPMGVREAEEKAKQLTMRPLANLQKSLSQLTDAHDKLRFLLQELDSLTKKKG